MSMGSVDMVEEIVPYFKNGTLALCLKQKKWK